jgi:hypothetical protein
MKSQKFNPYASVVFIAFLVSFFYFSPLMLGHLRGFSPELRFLGDLQVAGYPSFVLAREYAQEFIHYGMDLVTANGASSMFLRPNFGVYYPVQYLLLHTLGQFAFFSTPFLLFLMFIVNGTISITFSHLYIKRFLGLSASSALLCSVLYFAFTVQMYKQIPFYNVTSFFPAMLFVFGLALEKDERPNGMTMFWLSIPVLCLVTAGYLPIAIMAILIAYATNVIVLKKYALIHIMQVTLKMLPGLLLSVIYIGCLLWAVSIVPQLPKMPLSESLYYQDLSLTVKGFFSIFISAQPNDAGEAPHFKIGLPLILTYVVLFIHASRKKLEEAVSTVTICLIVFGLSIILSMGRPSGFAELFFYSVPALGSMHVYGRYMLITCFFLALGIAYLFNALGEERFQPCLTRWPAILVTLILLSCEFYPEFYLGRGMNVQQMLVELIYCGLILLAFNLQPIKRSIPVIILLLLLHQFSFMYQSVNWINFANPGNTSIDLTNQKDRKQRFIEFLLQNSSKNLVKYIDLTPEIEKPGGVQHNFPWHIEYTDGQRRIQSYMGYEQALSMQFEYAQRFSYFGQYSADYLRSTGVDYIIYDAKTRSKEAAFIDAVIDSSVPTMDIGHGYSVAKVIQGNLAVPQKSFDNGFFALSGLSNTATASGFQTDWHTFAKVNVDAPEAASLHLQIFPHKFWKYYLDGVEVMPVLSKDYAGSFPLSAGKHVFEMRYGFWPIKYFSYAHFLFAFAVLLISIGWLISRFKCIWLQPKQISA